MKRGNRMVAGRARSRLGALALAGALAWAQPASAGSVFDQWVPPDLGTLQGQPFPYSSPAGRMIDALFTKVMADPNPSMNFPYFWAWKTFVEINSPAHRNGNRGNRGQSGRSSRPQWESWASDAETFPACPDAGNPPEWPGRAERPKVLGPRAVAIKSDDFREIEWYMLETGVPTSVTVTDPQEVRRNKASFDYIAENGFYYTEGLAEAFEEVESAVEEAGGSPSRSMAAVTDLIKFPVESIEIKADWVPVENIPASERHEYYRNFAVVLDDDGNETGSSEYALVAMHISTKDLPAWFWATWMNKNVLGRCDYTGCRDDFGAEPSLTEPNDEANFPYEESEPTDELKAMMTVAGVDKVFENYRLVGAQTDFVDPTGQPTLNSNTITEQGQLQTGSCITCHARAAFDATGAFIDILSDEIKGVRPLPGDTFPTDNGAPNPGWFWESENGVDAGGDTVDYFSSATEITGVTAVQMDFVWGIVFANSTSADGC